MSTSQPSTTCNDFLPEYTVQHDWKRATLQSRNLTNTVSAKWSRFISTMLNHVDIVHPWYGIISPEIHNLSLMMGTKTRKISINGNSLKYLKSPD
jgi:hypothetical protein